jgi:hypothetical protein
VIDDMTVHEKTKLTLRLNKRLIEQAKEYAALHNISVSELVESYFLHLELKEESKHTLLVQQLTGILPADTDLQQEYEDYLVEKYGE